MLRPSPRQPLLRRAVMALALGSVTLSICACNTVKGVGRDIQSVGESADRAMHR